ncbi:hypothetical protein PG991_015926 [Apiospora marii]|uniref:Amidase domain-containing protein n=1 Tax=Apiospora marii TaxID=335849 RepID=A0ABR1R013_9PEZI
MASTTKDYKIIAAEKVSQRSSKIPKDWLIPTESFKDATHLLNIPTSCEILDEVEIEITSDYDATALIGKLQAGDFSAEQVAVAFCKRAAIAQQLPSPGPAASTPKDKRPRPHPSRPSGASQSPLKDSFAYQGHDTSTGLACYVDEPAPEHSSLAALLLDQGAVLYCKTNLPQSIMTGDSDNHVFGRTRNPRNPRLTAGGSTGGEGALNRVPAVCNGVYGCRPSVGVVPHGGVRDLTVPGTVGVMSSAGPLATSMRDISLFLETVMRAGTWKYDSTAISLPWCNLEPKKGPLRIGLVQNDGLYTPTPPVRRGLKKAADILRARSDIELVPITLPNVGQIFQDLLSYYTLSGSDYYFEQFNRTGEPLVPSLQALEPLLLRPGTTLKGFFDLNVRRAAAAKTYLSLLRDNGMDMIMMPPAPHTAVPLDKWSTIAYTGLWNYLDYPAVVIPVDQVRAEDVVDDVSNAQFGAEDARVYSLYTGPEEYRDAPICVQLIGYKHQDQVLMKNAARLDGIINGNLNFKDKYWFDWI